MPRMLKRVYKVIAIEVFLCIFGFILLLLATPYIGKAVMDYFNQSTQEKSTWVPVDPNVYRRWKLRHN
jgi:hypothetical protein